MVLPRFFSLSGDKYDDETTTNVYSRVSRMGLLSWSGFYELVAAPGNVVHSDNLDNGEFSSWKSDYYLSARELHELINDDLGKNSIYLFKDYSIEVCLYEIDGYGWLSLPLELVSKSVFRVLNQISDSIIIDNLCDLSSCDPRILWQLGLDAS